MTGGEFRFAYFTRRYEETRDFYARCLGMAVRDSWDRSVDDRGTVFQAGSGFIEVLAQPRSGTEAEEHVWDNRAPQGVFAVLEVEDAEAAFDRAQRGGAVVAHPLADQPWGHRSFCVLEPNGLTLFVYQELDVARNGQPIER